MTTYDLKNSLINKISNIEDPEFFEALNLFMDLKSKKKTYQTNASQKLVIEEGLAQLYRKEGILDDDFELKIREWLSERLSGRLGHYTSPDK